MRAEYRIIQSARVTRQGGWMFCRSAIAVNGDAHPGEYVANPAGTDQEKQARRGSRVWVVVGIAAFVCIVMAGVLVVGSSPGACSRCHSAQAATLASSAHTSVRCYQCHVDGGAWGMLGQKAREVGSMYPAALIGRGLTQPAVMTSRAACTQCHAAILAGVTSGQGLRIKHSVCAAGATCDTCHSSVAHGTSVRWRPGYSMDACVACHSANNVSITCKTCHLGEEKVRKSSTAAWQAIHGPNWRTTHGLGDQTTCGSCHEPTYCAKCHKVPVPHPSTFGATHGEAALQYESACYVCHKSKSAFCDACHGMPMPHSATFKQQHSKIAKNDSDIRCIRCHVSNDCPTCHSLHVHPGGSMGVPVPWPTTSESLRP